MRKCYWCGKEFETTDPEQDYCSLECYEADRNWHMQDLIDQRQEEDSYYEEA